MELGSGTGLAGLAAAALGAEVGEYHTPDDEGRNPYEFR